MSINCVYSIKCTPNTYCDYQLAITHSSQIVSKLQDTLDEFDFGQDYSKGGVVNNH